MKPDSKIKSDVLLELKWNASVMHENIHVDVDNGIVMLFGSVPSYMDKKAAEKAVASVAGVKAVVESLKVVLPGTPLVDDWSLAKSIVDQFGQTSNLTEAMVKINIESGWVTLTGEVVSDAQKNKAEEVVRSVVGVKGVSNHILLASRTVHPEDVKRKIEEALKDEVVRDAQNISVKVYGQKVILEGEVHSFKEMLSVRDAALKAPGVTSVDNNLLVGD